MCPFVTPACQLGISEWSAPHLWSGSAPMVWPSSFDLESSLNTPGRNHTQLSDPAWIGKWNMSSLLNGARHDIEKRNRTDPLPLWEEGTASTCTMCHERMAIPRTQCPLGARVCPKTPWHSARYGVEITLNYLKQEINVWSATVLYCHLHFFYFFSLFLFFFFVAATLNNATTTKFAKSISCIINRLHAMHIVPFVTL